MADADRRDLDPADDAGHGDELVSLRAPRRGRGRPPRFDLAALDVGDRLVVALNGRDPDRLWTAVRLAACYHARTAHPGFRIERVRIDGFVVAERVPDRPADPWIEAQHRVRVQLLENEQRRRRLTAEESARLERLQRRQGRAA